MEDALQPINELNSWVWKRFKTSLTELTPDEIHWRPLPQANNINVIIRHLRIEAEWHVDCLERGASMPEVTPQIQHLIDSVQMDFDKNLEEFEKLHTQFVAQLRKITADTLKQQSALAYHRFQDHSPTHLLGFHQAVHLAGHTAQISTIRNLFRTARGERARFFPNNPTYPK